MRSALVLSLLTVCNAIGQTTTIPLLAVSNAANRTDAVAPGSYLSVRVSTPLSGVPTIGNSLLDVTAIQIILSSVASGKVFTPAPIARPTPFEAWVIVPSDMPLGTATAALKVRGSLFATASFTVVSAAPGLFTRVITGYTWNTGTGSGNYSPNPSGPALAQNNPVVDPRVNGLTNPVVPGQFVTLWATGLGLSSLGTSGWTIDLAGTTVVPSFVGSHGLGLEQINFQIPTNPQIGCYVPLTLKHGDLISNQVTISIHVTPGACPHPLGLSYGELVTLDAGGTIRLGQISLSSGSVQTGPLSSKLAESVSANFGLLDANGVFVIAGTQVPYDQFFGCKISPRIGGGASGFGISGTADAGSPLVLTGPGGKQLVLTPTGGFGPYNLQLSEGLGPFFSAGTWTVGAPGNAEIGAFQRSFTLPPPISGLNRDELAALRVGDDVTVRWNNQGYGVDNIATVTLVGTTSVVTCRTYAFMGVIALPKIEIADTGATLALSIAPPPYARPEFTIPLIGASVAAGSVARTVVNYYYQDLAYVLFH
ncbi:MAG: hypothetical protein ABI824_01200 [Acidobacteriota bacterium]